MELCSSPGGLTSDEDDVTSFVTENIIKAYKSEPVLWDTHIQTTPNEKEKAWKRIAGLFDVTTDEVKVKVASFRSSLGKKLRVERNMTKPGEKIQVKFKYMHLLDFLRPHVVLKPRRNSPYWHQVAIERVKASSSDTFVTQNSEFETFDEYQDLSSDTDVMTTDDKSKRVSIKKEEFIDESSLLESNRSTNGIPSSASSSNEPSSSTSRVPQPPSRALLGGSKEPSSSTAVMPQLTSRSLQDCGDTANDRNWAFCLLLYSHLKEIDSASVRDDLQLEVLKMVVTAKRLMGDGKKQQKS